jgi:hypothetical protein
MMRYRIRGILAALALAATILFVPTSAAHAAVGPLLPTLTCDPTANTVRAVAAGDSLAANRPYKAVFRVTGGSYVTASTTATITGIGSEIAVPFTTDATGRYQVVGYERPWPAEQYLFYAEQVRVTILDATTGYPMAWRNASCTRDVRTTYTFECDPVAHTAVIRADGQRYAGLSSVRVRYHPVSYFGQPAATQPGFQAFYPDDEPAVRSVLVPVTADGTWSEAGHTYSHGDYYYLTRDWRIEVWATTSTGQQVLVGRGFGTCVTADQRP